MESPEQERDPAAAERLAAELDITRLLWLREKLKQQLMECGTAERVHITRRRVRTLRKLPLTFFADQQCYSDHDKESTSKEEHLQIDVEDAKISYRNRSLALQRSQLADALRNRMKQNDDHSRLILETVKHIVTLSNAIIECQQEVREKEQKLNDVKRKRLSLKNAEQQKLLEINTMVKQQKEEQANMEVSKTLEKIHGNLQKEREITTIIQHVFQHIIIGSRINWAEDPSLKAVVLQLEKDVCVL